MTTVSNTVAVTYGIPFEDISSDEFPETGGVGTQLFYTAGAAVLFVGFVLFASKKYIILKHRSKFQ